MPTICSLVTSLTGLISVRKRCSRWALRDLEVIIVHNHCFLHIGLEFGREMVVGAVARGMMNSKIPVEVYLGENPREKPGVG